MNVCLVSHGGVWSVLWMTGDDDWRTGDAAIKQSGVGQQPSPAPAWARPGPRNPRLRPGPLVFIEARLRPGPRVFIEAGLMPRHTEITVDQRLVMTPDPR